MHDTPTPSPPVLEYAPGPPPSQAARRALAGAFVLACILTGALIPYRIQPLRHTAVGLLALNFGQPQPLGSLSAQAQADATAIQASATALIPTFKAAGLVVTPRELNANLMLNMTTRSHLISVAFTSDNPIKSTQVVNIIMNTYVGSATRIRVAGGATPAGPPQRNYLYPLSGAAVGALISVSILLLRQRSLRRQRQRVT